MKHYDFKGDYYEDRARVRQHGRWFYVDLDGNRVGTESFDFASNFHEGLALVIKYGRWFFVDLEGNRVGTESFDNAPRRPVIGAKVWPLFLRRSRHEPCWHGFVR